jgi:aminoglycoside phosphotransferase family enzyme
MNQLAAQVSETRIGVVFLVGDRAYKRRGRPMLKAGRA